MNRGTVMEHAGDTAVVMTKDGQFLRVRTNPSVQVGQEINWAANDIVMARRGLVGAGQVRRMARFGAYAAAVAILVIAAVLWSFRDPVVVAYVSMDVNPSIEMGLDAGEHVRELRAVNRDAQQLIEGVAYQGKLVEQVAGILADKLADSNLLRTDQAEIVIASVRLRSVDKEWEIRVTDKIKQTLELAAIDSDPAAETSGDSEDLTIETVFLPVEVRDEAVEQGISSGKMAFYLAAEQSGYEVDLEELQSNSVREIASAMGGLKQVMDNGDKLDKTDREAWKKLLTEAKHKNEQLQADDRNADNDPAEADRENNGKNQSKGNGKSDNKGDGKSDNKGDGKSDGKSEGKNVEKNKGKSDDESRDMSDVKRDDENDGKRGEILDKDRDRGIGNGHDRDQEDQHGNDRDIDNDRDKDNDKNNDHGNDKGRGNGKGNDRGNGNDRGRGKS